MTPATRERLASARSKRLARLRASALRYGFGIAAVVAAALIQEAIWPFIPPSPQLLFFPCVLLVARVAGFRPAVLSVALSVPILLRWFLPPYGVLAVARADDVLDLVIYAVIAIVLARLVDRMRRAERKARIAIEAAPVPTALLAEDGRVLYANPAFVDALGVSVHDLEETTLQDLTHPSDAPAIRSAFRQLEKKQRDRGRRRSRSDQARLDARFVARGGRVIDGEGTIRSLRRAGPERYLAQFEDVTRRKTAEAERERLLAQLRTVIDECPVGLLIVREGGRVFESNATGLRLHGRELPSALDEPSILGDLLDAAGRPLPLDRRPSVRALAGERISGLELQMRRRDGMYVPILVNAAPVAVPPGDTAAAVVVFQDISAIKDLEQLRAQWNALVAHDLRQPINSILLRTQLLARSAQARPSEREEVDAIARATRRLNGMVQDLLDASRLEVRQMALARGEVRLAAFLAERIAEAQEGAPERRFDISMRDEDLAVWADADRLAQIMDNLLSNAIKYGRPSTSIRVVAGREGGRAFVEVSNQGEGISGEDLAHVFERFRRTDAAVRKGIRGTGLGLYIVRELVVAHGGQITCTSVPGGTTSFRFTIPLTKPASAAAAPN